MAEHREEQNSLFRSASAAHTVRSAVKTGKAVAGAARGAAAGPFGAVLGAVVQSRHTIAKACAAAAALLALPLLFLLMLPALIFGGLADAFSGDSEQPVLNDETVISDEMTRITASIQTLLGEGIDDVTHRIQADFSGTGGEHYEIVNPYAENLLSNTNILIGQYCASMDQDWENISLEHMEATICRGKEHLYTYTMTTETRVTEDDPTTPEDESGSETWYVYTIVYQGEAYFADQIFHLSQDQKEIAEDFAQNLSQFLGDGTYQGIHSEDAVNGIPALGQIRFTDGATPVVYYNQLDQRYASQPYGTDHIGGYGCGPTAMAIVVSSLTDDLVDPVEMARWAYEHHYWCSKSGSFHALIPNAAKAWGLPVEGCTPSEPQRLVDALSQGKLVVALMTKGHFTSGGHFIVLRGVQGDKILVADPSSYTRSQKAWDLSIILNEASRRAAAGGPFWIIG